MQKINGDFWSQSKLALESAISALKQLITTPNQSTPNAMTYTHLVHPRHSLVICFDIAGSYKTNKVVKHLPENVNRTLQYHIVKSDLIYETYNCICIHH